MRANYLYFLVRLVLFITDLLILNASFVLVFLVINQFNHLSDIQYRHYLLIFNFIWVLSANYFRMYNEENVKSSEHLYSNTWKSLAALAVLFVFYLMFTRDTIFSRQFLILLFFVLFIMFLISRFIGTFFELRLKHLLNAKKLVAVLGRNKAGNQLANYFESHPGEYQFEGFLNEESDLFLDDQGKILPKITKAIGIAGQSGVSEVYVPLRPEQIIEARSLLKEAERLCVRLKFVPVIGARMDLAYLKLEYMDEYPVISVRKEPLEETTNRFRKRAFDILFSSLVILLIMSWLTPIIAIIIKLQGKGPVFFRQLRSGRDNMPFICYKFRSMNLNQESDKLQATENDARITKFGKFLRKSSLDELPQFYNVLIGEMSVVGPRPHMLKHTKDYSAIIDSFMIRHFLKPGITGWAQVNGYRGKTENPIQMRKRVACDIWYLENWSVMLDVKIIFLTIIQIFKGDKNAF